MVDWVCLAASVEGSSHQSRGTDSNDAFATVVAGSTAIIAVADGAGSAAQSTIGANVAVDAAVAALQEHGFASHEPNLTHEEHLRAAILSARAAVLARATELEADPRELACTLLLCVATNEGIFAAQVGDGAIVAAVGNEYRLLCAPPRGEFLNETIFLTSDEALEYLVVTHTEVDSPRDLKHVAVFSDGLQTLALDLATDTPHSPFFNPLFGWVIGTDASESMLTDFLRSARVRDKTDDDVTLVLLADRNAKAPVLGKVSPSPALGEGSLSPARGEGSPIGSGARARRRAVFVTIGAAIFVNVGVIAAVVLGVSVGVIATVAIGVLVGMAVWASIRRYV